MIGLVIEYHFNWDKYLLEFQKVGKKCVYSLILKSGHQLDNVGIYDKQVLSLIGDHTFITSAYFWPFWIPPTHLISMNYSTERQKNWPFSRPTHSVPLLAYNIGMVPKLHYFYDI